MPVMPIIFMPEVGGRFTSVVSTFYTEGGGGELRWIGDCKSALTAASSDATRLLISMLGTTISTMINTILGSQ